MIRKLVSVVVLVFIFMGVLGLTIDVHVVEAPYPMIYIRDDGSIVPSSANITSSDNVTYTFVADINASIVVERSNIVIDGGGHTLQGYGGGNGIGLSGISNVTIKDVNIKSFQYGVYLNSSSHSVISENNIANNSDGVRLENSSNFNSVSRNRIADNIVGIRLYSLYGDVFLEHNSIFGNNITNNEDGISLLHCSNNIISGNNLENNTDGIVIYRSLNNTISGNSVKNNRGYGVYLDTSYDNRIYHNNFVDNGIPWYFYSSTNTWDAGYPSGGNYWSDYEERYPDAEELDDSGIWDTPYFIDEDNQDNYPLMYPWGVPPTISILSPENKTYTAEDVPLTFTVSESTPWMGYSLDGQANVTITGNTTLSGLSDGSHSLRVYAKDTAGNTGASETIYFTIETEKAESFPTWILPTIVIIAIVGVATLVYFKKFKK